MLNINMGATLEEMKGMIESFANAVKDGSIDLKEIVLTDVSHLSHTMLEFGGEDHRVELTKILQIEFISVPPKKIKTQAEVYDELFWEHYERLEEAYKAERLREDNVLCLGLSDEAKDKIKIQANIYACKNTVKVWKEQ